VDLFVDLFVCSGPKWTYLSVLGLRLPICLYWV